MKILTVICKINYSKKLVITITMNRQKKDITKQFTSHVAKFLNKVGHSYVFFDVFNFPKLKTFSERGGNSYATSLIIILLTVTISWKGSRWFITPSVA